MDALSHALEVPVLASRQEYKCVVNGCWKHTAVPWYCVVDKNFLFCFKPVQIRLSDRLDGVYYLAMPTPHLIVCTHSKKMDITLSSLYRFWIVMHHSSRQLSDSLKYSNINGSIDHKIRWQIIHREESDLYSSMPFSRQLSITCGIYCADIKLATAVQYSTIGSSGSSINLGFQPPHPSCYKYQYTLLCLRFGSGKLCVLQNF